MTKIQVVNPFAAGFDGGSRSYYVAVGEGKDQVKEFSVYHSGKQGTISYLKENGISTVAMESTGGKQLLL